MCQELVTGGALQGMGKTLSCSVITIILTAARIPLALVLGKTGLGAWTASGGSDTYQRNEGNCICYLLCMDSEETSP